MQIDIIDVTHALLLSVTYVLLYIIIQMNFVSIFAYCVRIKRQQVSLFPLVLIKHDSVGDWDVTTNSS